MSTPDMTWTVTAVVLIAVAALGCAAPANLDSQGDGAERHPPAARDRSRSV